MQLFSDYRALCQVSLPFANRQKYMHSFDLASPKMSEGFEDYLTPVMRLIDAAGANSGIAHMTVDEKVVQAGMSQRRPRPHVDGCFMPLAGYWGQQPGPGWLHNCNNVGHGVVGRMAVIVASSVAGCRAWRGVFAGQPASDGDLSHLLPILGDGEVVPANMGYLFSPDCVHESMIFGETTVRTFLRIALPLKYEFVAST